MLMAKKSGIMNILSRYLDMNKLIKKVITLSMSIISVLFMFVPETFFLKFKILADKPDEMNIIFNRFLSFVLVFLLCAVINILYRHFRKSVCIQGHNYSIKVEYGNLFEFSDCKKVINFDECFTTTVGEAPADIKPGSVCGQYLENNPIQDMQPLIDSVNLKPARSKSEYKNKIRYESGKIVPNSDYLLLSFARLDKNGAGKFFTLDEFLECLSTLWKEIDIYYAQKDVCIPILGSGITRIENSNLTQQELLDIIIESYKLSPHKIKAPNKLHIVCRKNENFSLNKIGETL